MSDLNTLAETPLPFLSDAALHIQGELKATAGDFVVEEIPIYTPSGEGEHLYLRIEKRDLSAEQLLQHLAKQLQVHRNDIGMAGLKDRRAFTRQWVSVPISAEEKVTDVESEQVRVLQQSRHTNKLKTGHLRGNHFTITIRGGHNKDLATAEKIRDAIYTHGIPNYFGSQRFGIDGETLTTGARLLRGELDQNKIPRQRRKFLTRLSLSAVQSAIFNAVLSSRINNDTSHQVRQGDVLQVVKSGGPFVSAEPDVDQIRFDEREVVTTGPLFGPKMKMPTDGPLEEESSLLQDTGLSLDCFAKFKKLTPGARRPLLLWLEDLSVTQCENGLQFQFELPTGAYATIVMREFLKPAD